MRGRDRGDLSGGRLNAGHGSPEELKNETCEGVITSGICSSAWMSDEDERRG
jgi:hypothetical protein